LQVAPRYPSSINPLPVVVLLFGFPGTPKKKQGLAPDLLLKFGAHTRHSNTEPE